MDSNLFEGTVPAVIQMSLAKFKGDINMDWKTFVNIIAWPVVVILIILIFKKPLSKLIPSIKKIDMKFLLIEFERGTNEVEDILQPETKEEKHFIYSPITEINDIWLEIENNCRELLKKNKYPIPKTYRALGSRIKKYNLIDEKHRLVLDKLRQLRNIAVRIGEKEIPQKVACKFINLSTVFINYINQELEN